MNESALIPHRVQVLNQVSQLYGDRLRAADLIAQYHQFAQALGLEPAPTPSFTRRAFQAELDEADEGAEDIPEEVHQARALEAFNPEAYGFQPDVPGRGWYVRSPTTYRITHHLVLGTAGEWTLTARLYDECPECGSSAESERLFTGRIPNPEFVRELLRNVGHPQAGTAFNL